MDKEKIVTIRTFDSAIEAEMVKGILEGAGIASSLIHETIQSVLPLGGGIAIELCVAAEDEQRAKEVLAAKVDREEFAKMTASPEKPKRKCACGPKRK